MSAKTLVSTMPEITIDELKSVVKHIGVGQYEPIMIWGRFGIGKSEAIAQVAWEYHLKSLPKAERAQALELDAPPNLVDIRMAQFDSVDFRGMPDLDRENKLAVWYAPAVLPVKGNHLFVEDNRPIFLFLDELNSARTEVMAIGYQLLQNRSAGEHKLMDNVVVIAAGNREMDRGITNRMPLPLCNRMLHYELVFDIDQWCDYMIGEGHDPVAIGFFKFRSDLLTVYNPEVESKVMVTPRTAEKAIRILNANIPQNIKWKGIQGAIGVGPATEFDAYIQMAASLPSIEDIVDDPESVKVPVEASMQYAICMALSQAMGMANVKPIAAYLAKFAPEFQMMVWFSATKRDDTLYQTSEWANFSKLYRNMMPT